MRKLFIIIKKEIRELLTPQMLAPMLAVVLLFFIVGNIIGKEGAKLGSSGNMAVLDLDRTRVSQEASGILLKNFSQIRTLSENNINSALSELRTSGKSSVLLVIPAGFSSGLSAGLPQKIGAYSTLTGLSLISTMRAQSITQATAILNNYYSKKIALASIKETDFQFLTNPIRTDEFVMVGDKVANVPLSQVVNVITSQTVFIPIVLFLVIVLASQLVAIAVATEKENKTLETLLSLPVNRVSIVAGKLVAAGAVALFSACIYLWGMSNYMNGITGVTKGPIGAAANSTQQALASLGLVFHAPDYIILGIVLFLGIIAALAIAVVLGAFAEDAKGVQGVTTPLMIIIFIPYLLTLFVDLSSASPFLKILVYAIPFSYPFMAAGNILLGNFSILFWGMAYLFIFFLAAVYLASWIFSSDKLLTLKFKFPGKKKHGV